MAIEYSIGKRTSLARVKVGVAALLGLSTFVIVGKYVSWHLAPLLGWDVAALIILIWVWATIWPLNGKLTAQHARREDPSRTTADAVVLASSIASLAAVAIVLVDASNTQGGAKLFNVALGVVSVVIGWVVVHTLFLLRYAELYYYETPGGVDFGGTEEPDYRDFAYLAFTLGMTFQVSDTDFKNSKFRRTALGHALISYLFGTIIVATTINLIAGLIK
jgi:uncharacterized membrane protein